jgi:hypothetical protein
MPKSPNQKSKFQPISRKTGLVKAATLLHKQDLVIYVPTLSAEETLAGDRLVFDGYKLYWQGQNPDSYTAFSGAPDESAKESTKDIGPTPQGLYAVDPAKIQNLEPSDDWGRHRVPLEPYADTVQRMKDCFKLIRTGMYIHGGEVLGTHGCIEINDDPEEERFFSKLRRYGRRIELEVRFVGARKTHYEESACPY